jgi:fengycin family lipopeptide synthetase D
MHKHDPIALNARKQALKEFILQQGAPEYRDCPFFAIRSQSHAAVTASPSRLTIALPDAVSQRIFSMAAASPLHRQSLFSACLKYLAFLHCREPEGVLAWYYQGMYLPASWKFGPADLQQPVKRLFGSELALWRQADELCSGLSPNAVKSELAALPQVRVSYAEHADPLQGMAPASGDAAGQADALEIAPESALEIGIAAGPQASSLHLQFDPARVDQRLLKLFGERFILLLQGMLADPAATLGTLSWVPPDETERIRTLSAAVPAAPLAFANVAQVIDHAITTRPAATFLQMAQQSVCFADLVHYSAQLLAAPGWPAREALGDCILIVGPKGIEATLAALVCMRIGKAFCLQPDQQPEAQLAGVLEVHQTRLVLLAPDSADLGDIFVRHGSQVVICPRLHLDGNLPHTSAAPIDSHAGWLQSGRQQTPDSCLCVLMTSGSEGQPKGSMATQRALLNLAQQKQHWYGLAHSRVASMANHAFDYFVLECVEAMLLDIVLVLAPAAARVDAVQCVKFLREQRIDHLCATTVLAEDIMAQGEIPGLRQLIFGGESLRQFSRHNYALVNVYGPSETGVIATCAPIHANGQHITIGKPIEGFQCLIVFPGTVECCPPGVPGELLIGGIGVGLGYLNRPDLTAKAFIQVDQSEQYDFQGRFYRSGDMCWWNPDGEIEIQGRRDRQLKVNGFRVELDAIERCLCQLPGVRQAAVIGLSDRVGHAQLGAVVAAADGINAEQVRSALASRLPDYMLPGRITLVAALPLNRNGKLDRQHLKTLLNQANRDQIIAPSGAIQNWLAECWARQLELEAGTVCAGRSFFALGGHSLRAARMLAEVNRAYGIEVPLLEFFRNDSIIGLARMVQVCLAVPAPDAAHSFRRLLTGLSSAPASIPAHAPLSAQEARLYAQYRLYPESLAYLLQMQIPLPGSVTQETLVQALQTLLARHDILLTLYRVDANGTPYAESMSNLDAAQLLIDAADWPQTSLCPFILEQGPLLRASMLESVPDHSEQAISKRYLHLQIHHILVDEPAMQTLADEFARLVQGETLPAAPPGYRQYALAQARARQLPIWGAAQTFWRDALQGLEFDPFGHGAVDAAGHVANLSWHLNERQRATCQRLCNSLNQTPANLFLALWGLVVAREGNSDAFAISVANAFGVRQGLDTVGMFVTMVPYGFRFGHYRHNRPNSDHKPSFADYARQLAEMQWQSMDHLFFPIEEAFPLLDPDPRRFGSNPLLNLAFSCLEADPASSSTATASGDDQEVEAQGPLSLAVSHSASHCHMTLEYQKGVFDAAQIERIASAWQDLLQQLDTHAPAAWQVDDWVAAAARFTPPRQSVPGTALDQILRRNFTQLGQQTALVDAEGALSWQDFAALSAGMAQQLNHAGVRRALIIGVGGRHLQAFLAACLLTHTTYMVLERGTPAARIEEVIQHAKPDLVIDTDHTSFSPLLLDWPQFASVKSSADNPLAWILYSSGTTGRPKGICVASSTVANYLAALTERLQLAPGLRIAQQFSPSFDGYLEEVLLAWALAGTSLVVDRYSLLDERRARAFLQEQQPDLVSAAPALLAAWNSMPDLKPLPRVFISGGDFLAAGAIRHLRQHMQIWNSYGPTETCIAASMANCSQITDQPGQDPATLSIGVPFSHVAYAVADPEGRHLRTGQWGELLIYGDFSQHAYLDDPARSAERFGQDQHGHFFRTGDMAMFNHEGRYFLRGRMDDSCKVRGNFIGLGELEGKAGQYPGVLAAGAAVAWPGTPEACLVLAVQGEPDSLAGLQQFLARHYTRSHLPSAIFPLQALPRTDTGKLDRHALLTRFHEWHADPANSSASDEAALKPDMRDLLACWRSCLGYQGPLGPESDFFLVSGSSLSAVRLAGQIESQFGISFSPVDVFRHATLAAQSALIEARRSNLGQVPFTLLPLNPDLPHLPQLILLPPALGVLQELQGLAQRWSGQVSLVAVTLAPEACTMLTQPQLEAALLACLRAALADSSRSCWLGGYSLGAEMLAALLERHSDLQDGVERVVLLDPNLNTQVFDGSALLAELMSLFRSINQDVGLVALPADMDEASLHQQHPALYREWCHYRWQHAMLDARSFTSRAQHLAGIRPALNLMLSGDANPQELAALPPALAQSAALRQMAGNHVEFLQEIQPDQLTRPARR